MANFGECLHKQKALPDFRRIQQSLVTCIESPMLY